MLKFLIRSLIVIAILAGIGYAAYPSITAAIAERNKPNWRIETVKLGTITKVVNATGTVKPTKSVQVGSFVSGPITDLFVEFNQEVKQNEILAKIDPRLFAANVARDKATLATRKAEVLRVKALLQQARNDEGRALGLRQENVDFIAKTEMDALKFNRISLEAQLTIAMASIDQSVATLTNSQANLDFCEIRSPEDGMIIDRKVEPGQTLAAQFQTPELFVVGVGMREKMHIFADVDESEIGMIRKAAETEQPVSFTVTSYPDDLFIGKIEEVRFSSATTQNVVTYPVVVGSPNPELKLLPGMTADLSFQIEKLEKAIRIPKSALRFYPPDKKYVHPDDHAIIDGATFVEPKEESVETTSDERVTASKKNKIRHVWVVEGDLLRAVEVTVGLTDNRYAQMISGDLKDGAELVIGQKAAGE
ncbi:MAG: efflux RND transporter periplasmic adaptor subunit [Mariniblastus sp.]